VNTEGGIGHDLVFDQPRVLLRPTLVPFDRPREQLVAAGAEEHTAVGSAVALEPASADQRAAWLFHNDLCQKSLVPEPPELRSSCPYRQRHKRPCSYGEPT